MISRCNQMPTVECPKCGKEFQIADYYEIEGKNEEEECPFCDTILYATAVDYEILVDFSTEKQKL